MKSIPLAAVQIEAQGVADHNQRRRGHALHAGQRLRALEALQGRGRCLSHGAEAEPEAG